MSEEIERNDQGELYSQPVRAGKRTYFFDVKSTKGGDYYLTITESKKRFNEDGKFFFEKHKIFLYKEDFEKFSEGLAGAIEFIKNNSIHHSTISSENHSSNISFDDLGNNS